MKKNTVSLTNFRTQIRIASNLNLINVYSNCSDLIINMTNYYAY